MCTWIYRPRWVLALFSLKRKKVLSSQGLLQRGGESALLEVSHKWKCKESKESFKPSALDWHWRRPGLPPPPPNHKICAESGSELPLPGTITKCWGCAVKGRNSTRVPSVAADLLWSSGDGVAQWRTGLGGQSGCPSASPSTGGLCRGGECKDLLRI